MAHFSMQPGTLATAGGVLRTHDSSRIPPHHGWGGHERHRL